MVSNICEHFASNSTSRLFWHTTPSKFGKFLVHAWQQCGGIEGQIHLVLK